MERKSRQLKEDAYQILRQLKVRYNSLNKNMYANCSILQIKYEMDVYVEKTNTFAVQIRGIFLSNMMHSE